MGVSGAGSGGARISTFLCPLRRRISLRRTSSTAAVRSLTVWNRSNGICAFVAYSRTRLAYAAHICKALLDRVTDGAHIIETGTESYRFRRTVEGREKKKVT